MGAARGTYGVFWSVSTLGKPVTVAVFETLPAWSVLWIAYRYSSPLLIFVSTKREPVPSKTTCSSLLPRAQRLTTIRSSGLVDVQRTRSEPARLATPTLESAGAVASYLSWIDADVTLPALSRQLPVAVAVALAFPEKGADVQLAIPERASVPAQVIVTGCVYQPSKSGGRLSVAPVMCGGVASYFSSKAGPAGDVARLVVARAARRPKPRRCPVPSRSTEVQPAIPRSRRSRST